jgi:ABC-2 type transport system permease protein
MRVVLAIVRKELTVLFASPIAYIALTAVALSMSLFYLENLRTFNAQIMLMQSRMAMDGMTAGMLPPGLNLFDMVLLPTVTDTALVLLAVVPLVTMGVFCEEKTRRTDELLLTLPLSDTQVVAGKFLATYLFLTVLVAVTSLFPAISVAHAGIDPGPMVAAFIGMLFFSFCLASIGLVCSALATSQLVAALSAYAVCLGIYDFGWLTQFTDNLLGPALRFLSLLGHLEGFSRGVISLTHLVYFAGLCLFGFLLARVSLALERID